MATWITLSRLPLLALVVATLYRGTPALKLLGVGLLLLGLFLDTVDGAIARKRKETSLLGGVLDIAADRAYELVLWMCFADLGMIPVLMPLIVVTRTALTDAFRSVGVGQGTAPFGQIAGRLGRFLVASAWLRTGYSVSKFATFGGLALARALVSGPGLDPAVMGALQTLAWISVALCLLRGLPVIVEGIGSSAPSRHRHFNRSCSTT